MSYRAGRIAIPDTAFSIERTRQKRPRVENKDHLGFIRSLPCVICGATVGIQAAHIRARSPQFKKRQAGHSERPDDKWTVPLCAEHHLTGDDAQHDSNELIWWARQGIDPFVLALGLFGCQGDREEAVGIIEHAMAKP